VAGSSWISQRSVVVALWSFYVVCGGGLRCAVLEQDPLYLPRAGVSGGCLASVVLSR
jgi:hypothetical protein